MSSLPDAAPPAGGTLDLLVCGELFYDLVYSGLPRTGPVPGQELWTREFASRPGGIANFAVAASRLGLATGMAAAVGSDDFGKLCWDHLGGRENVDMSSSRLIPGWAQPVTVALNFGGDRALVTAGSELPVTADELFSAGVPQARLAVCHLQQERDEWLAVAASQGTRIIADVGWDATGRWDAGILDQLEHCHAFIPNDGEAMAYTGTSTALDAARKLSDRTAITVVTGGRDGVVGIDSGRGQEVVLPALDVAAIDSTGAGDVFGAALCFALLQPWTFEQQLRFASLVAAIAVSSPRGAAGAPGLADLLPWLDRQQAPHLGTDYAFLTDFLQKHH